MKKISLSILFISGVLCNGLSAQTILAGQTTGPNIHYFEIQDTFLTDSSYCFDFDQDNSCDLEISSYYQETHVGYDEGIVVKAYRNTQYCAFTDENNWVMKYNPGDTIGKNCIWAADNGIIWEHTWYITSGEFYYGRWGYGEGYVGFRIINEADTISGWVRILGTNQSYLTIYDYAIYSAHLSAGTLKGQDQELNYNSIVTDNLFINVNIKDGHRLDYWCINNSGEVVATGVLSDGRNEIPFNSMKPGMYFCRIGNSASNIKVLKVIRL